MGEQLGQGMLGSGHEPAGDRRLGEARRRALDVCADWFQPVIRIGAKGMNDIPLKAVNVMPADEQPRRLNPTIPVEDDPPKDGADNSRRYPVRLEQTKEFATLPDDDPFKVEVNKLGHFKPVPKDSAARAIWQSQNLEGRLVAEFVAPDAGDLFFYVNDAVQIFPRLLPESWVPSWLDAIQGPRDLFYRNNSGTAKIKVQRLPAPPMPLDKPESPLARN